MYQCPKSFPFSFSIFYILFSIFYFPKVCAHNELPISVQNTTQNINFNGAKNRSQEYHAICGSNTSLNLFCWNAHFSYPEPIRFCAIRMSVVFLFRFLLSPISLYSKTESPNSCRYMTPSASGFFQRSDCLHTWHISPR